MDDTVHWFSVFRQGCLCFSLYVDIHTVKSFMALSVDSPMFLWQQDGHDHTEGHDDDINDPIKKHIGDQYVFTPAEQRALGRWPTLREMREVCNCTVTTAWCSEIGSLTSLDACKHRCIQWCQRNNFTAPGCLSLPVIMSCLAMVSGSWRIKSKPSLETCFRCENFVVQTQ